MTSPVTRICLTFSCFKRWSLLKEVALPWLSVAIDRAAQRHGFELVAFVYMPEHVHLLVHPKISEYRTSGLLYAIKKPFSWRVKQYLEARRSPWLEKLTVIERAGKPVFRFWQKGPGYDSNLVYDEGLIAVADYVHHNPVRRGLVATPDQWKWSSWRFFHRPDESPLPGLPHVDGFPGN